MKIYGIKKPCPYCRSKISIGLFSDRGKIIRCPSCGQLMMDDPKTNYFLILLIFAGIGLSMVLRKFLGESVWRDLAILALFSIAYLLLIRLKKVKKELVIRNKQTNERSFIDHSDWEEILENTTGKENIFEIEERL